ncbi:MAG: sulfurtransferase [Betaproteobacteria bacterium]|nr:sulfurtransferase [Betaproteobacteria bacterium]
MQQISARQLANWLSDRERPKPILVDVREPWEFDLCHIPGSLPMPMNAVPARHPELPQDCDVVVICHHGGRSMQVAMYLQRAGYSRLYNLASGVEGWATEVDPAMRRY